MKFVDELVLTVASGKGGDGLVAFRREKFVARGGPSGGDGGRGGDVWLEANTTQTTLYELSFQRKQDAENGKNGGPKDMHGADGRDCVVVVPVGTLVFNHETGEQLGDLDVAGARLCVARGGRGGRGNARFASAVRRAPRMAEKGEPGTSYVLRLELKLLADVGLVGLPNAGKSTFLRAVSNARPKVADYPFTTLVPCLGIVKPEHLPAFCMADIPGLIEGAHRGQGLGIQFLRHVERTRLLVHLVDLSVVDVDCPLREFDTICQELQAFSPSLAAKPMLVIGNKMDLPDARAVWPVFQAAVRQRNLPVFSLSSATKEGVPELLKMIIGDLTKAPEIACDVRKQEQFYGFVPPFCIATTAAGVWSVQGREIENLVAMTDFTNDEAIAMFLRNLRRLGFLDELRRMQVQPEDRILIGDMEFTTTEFLS